MKNAEVIIRNLQDLIDNNKDPDEDGIYCENEYGENLTDYIDCPHYSCRDCLNEKRNVDYKESDWDSNCTECKAKWLLEEYE